MRSEAAVAKPVRCAPGCSVACSVQCQTLSLFFHTSSKSLINSILSVRVVNELDQSGGAQLAIYDLEACAASVSGSWLSGSWLQGASGFSTICWTPVFGPKPAHANAKIVLHNGMLLSKSQRSLALRNLKEFLHMDSTETALTAVRRCLRRLCQFGSY